MWAVINHLAALIICVWGALNVIDFVVWWIKDEIEKKKKEENLRKLIRRRKNEDNKENK